MEQAFRESNALQRQRAKTAYAALRQGDQLFDAFWADFTRLALQIGKSTQDQYKNLQEKMFAELLRELSSLRPSTRRLERGAPPAPARNTPDKTVYPSPLALTAGLLQRSPSPGQATRLKLKRVSFKKDDTVTCFYCNKPGHLRPDCPDLHVNKIEEAESDFGDESSGPDEKPAESENEMP
ncbi:hypothetical protein EPUS_09498 [Endocarpon pusillum Z07020]|uniref:CCHC-type domain-containing protein n=1 Tax=Endocarpon pusillum (strain Z07020 / HMAS-L-300199) TaxID=1263415 RepID=U1GF50_ENDPU|nr:uncharacterized protein EPUS_09498 [Endocarpon pusillum Z07020]ERF70366.1 hypothetical protein EPUS_09498 [Endocarpon pusillum Z07020]